jgi:peptide/nickel transport system substrate-binding protein
VVPSDRRPKGSLSSRIGALAVSAIIASAACGGTATTSPSAPPTESQPAVPSVAPVSAPPTLGSVAPASPTAALPSQATPTAAGSCGTLTFARTADIFTFDPYNTQDDRSIFTELQVYERLVRLSADGKGVDPELATAWTLAPDSLSATFTLRDGVKFSDGSPLTADDVVFSLTRAIDQQGSWGFLFSPVTAVTKVDEKTVKLVMSEAFAPLLPALSTFAASIYSKSNFEKYGDRAGEHPLGTGAFMLDTWEKGSQLTLVRNPNYWRVGQPCLDKVVFTVVGDDNARVLQLQSGAADIIDFVPPNQVESIKAAGFDVEQVNGTAVDWITLNNQVKPLTDPKVRCAMGWALDRDAIAQNVYFGLAVPAKSMLPSSSFYYDPNTNPVGYDLARARQLLSASSAPNGFEVEALVASGDSANLASTQIWAASLKQLGITLNVKQVEATTGQDLYNTEKYQTWISAWTNDTPDPDEMMGVALDYHNQNALHTGYHNDQAVSLVNRGRAELDPAKRQQIYSQLQSIINQDCPQLYTVEVPRLYASSVNVRGFMPNSQGKYSLENVLKTP